MKKSKVFSKVLSFLLAVVLVLTSSMVSSISAQAATKVNGYVDPYDGDQVKVVKQKSYTLVPGVTEADIVLNDQTGNAQVMAYMTTISPDANVTLKATYAGYYDADKYDKASNSSRWEVGEWNLTTTTSQAAAYEAATGENVIFATNGDYFNMQTGQPSGPLFINGRNLNPAKTKSEPYFALLKDGSYVIREAGTDTSDVVEAASGPFFLVKDGVNVCNPGFTTEYPVNSVGFKADGSIVFFMADGRQYPTSVGMSQYEQAEFLVSQGVVRAIYLDGGGSATVVSQREGEDELKIRNNPSDGSERSISSGFLLVANATSDGIFDHATISSEGDLYTPSSVINFTAKGVDAAGGFAELPETGLAWSVSEASQALGSIDASTGAFTSNGTLGDVTVILSYEGVEVGSATVKVVEPDSIYFSSASASLDFEESSSLGLVVRSENADIIYKNGDFNWNIVSNTAGVSDASVGSMNGNSFVAAKGAGTMNATATVSYTRTDGTVLSASIDIEIGKMPVVAFDFEPNENGPLTGAHFHWGKNTYVAAGVSEGYYGAYDTLTVPTSNTYSAVKETGYSTLTAPYVFTGNYDTAVPAAEIFKRNGYSFYLWPNNSITEFCAGKVSTTSEADGGQVRFGDYSLELNYDYATYNGSSNSNYYIRYCGEPYLVAGQPTQLGMWVYADAETYNLKGYLLYSDIAVFNGSTYTTKNLPLIHDVVAEDGTVSTSGEVDWVGWKYCYTDLSSLASYYSPEHPYQIRTGEGLIWLSYQPKKGGGRYSGTFYFDNYRFVYGTDLDDLDNPYFTNLTVNGDSVLTSNDVVINTSAVEIAASFADVDGKNASGVDATKTVIVVDGNEIACDGDSNSAVTRLELANGLHSVQVTVYDMFGNYSTTSSFFTVKTDDSTATAELTGADTVVMGSNYELVLGTTGNVSGIDMTVIQLNSDFGEPVVTASEGWEVKTVYSSTGFKKAKMEIEATWVGEGTAPADATVAVLSFNVPTDLDPEIDFFTYQVLNTTCETLNGKTTAAQAKVTISLSAYYTVSSEVSVAGRDTVITVTDPNGEVAQGVEVYVNDSYVGTTDENGKIALTISTTAASGTSFTVNVKNGSLVSFTTTITVMSDPADAAGTPVSVAITASKDGLTEKTLTWFSSVSATNAAAIVEYSVSENMSDSKLATGESTEQGFSTSKQAARINTVKLTGLEEGKTYFYRVGDGNVWSEVKSFSTVASDDTVSFFVVGDTQMSGSASADASDIALLDSIGKQVQGYTFGIQTGDYVDNGGNYNMWAEMNNTFATSFAGIDMVHTMGNHEYYGDATGVAASKIYNLEGKENDYYSVEYGNVYVAVINYSANLTEACAWLVEDAKASDATWKVLSVHQPAYYTNVNGGSERFNKAIPAAAEAAGINAVFSGHDHSYARTNPMIGGEVSEDGIVYFICGDLGEKSRNINYAATNTPAFNFAKISQDYSAIVVKAVATDTELTFTICDADGTVIDEYTMESGCAEGHTWATYNRETKLMKCEVCGTEADPLEELYSGWLVDEETELQMYFASGKACTGFNRVDNVPFVFGQSGLLDYTGLTCYKGKIYYSIDGICQLGLFYFNDKYYYFGDDYSMKTGYVTVPADKSNGILTKDTTMLLVPNVEIVSKNGAKYYYLEGFAAFAGFVEYNGDYYYVLPDGKIATGKCYVSKTNNMIYNGTYVFDENGVFDLSQVKAGIFEENGKLYYYRLGKKTHAGLIKLDGYYYYSKSDGQIVTGKYYVSVTNGLMEAGSYKFDEQGRMILPEVVVVKNGIVEENGELYYYVNDKKVYAGLIEIDGALYYINSSYKVVAGTSYYVSKTNGLVPAGRYTFDAEGKMVVSGGSTETPETPDTPDVPVTPVVKNGIVVEDGIMFYYVNDRKTYAGLIEIDGNYYYVNSSYKVVTGKYYVTKTNDLMAVGSYTFAEDGKMIVENKQANTNAIEEAENKNGEVEAEVEVETEPTSNATENSEEPVNEGEDSTETPKSVEE